MSGAADVKTGAIEPGAIQTGAIQTGMPKTGAPPRGLPDHLPEGERLLWQGAPEWRTLARRAMHVRGLSVYFAIILSWCVVSWLHDGMAPVSVAVSTLQLALFAVVPIALLIGYAWLISRTTIYTLTNRRVAVRTGLALPITFNLPFGRIEAVSMRLNADGTGDICLLPNSSDRLAYLILWPHVRPWRVNRAEPMLRSIACAEPVGKLLATALSDSTTVNSPPRDLPVGDLPLGEQPLAPEVAPEVDGPRRLSPVAA